MDSDLTPHVFVAFSDITRLRCDAWLLPCDQSLSITAGWRKSAPRDALTELEDEAFIRQWSLGKRAQKLRPWHAQLGSAPAPIPVVTDVGGWQGRDMSWYLDGISSFTHAADPAALRSRSWRTKPLLAVPLIGTGAGGKKRVTGEMEMALLAELQEQARINDVDFVLVLNNEASYASAQAVRRAKVTWPLREATQGALDELATRARRGELVLFIGAGLSKAAGLPSWSELLQSLAADLGFHDVEGLDELSPLDAASILERRCPDSSSFRKAIAGRTSTPCFGLGHALTASLPVMERVTTNYDECIEDSLAAASRKPRILPDHPAAPGDGWLLKLHGTVSEPDDIVLTRQDYLRFDDRRGALRGIVQAMLLTRHILFLGFSLRDDNFHALADEVRRALEDLQERDEFRERRFGTVFIAPSGKTASEFWESDLRIEFLGDNVSYPRTLEIALDYLSSSATSAVPHLLDDNYDAMLTDEEKELKSLARRLEASLTGRQWHSTTFIPVVDLLRKLGSTTAGRQSSDP